MTTTLRTSLLALLLAVSAGACAPILVGGAATGASMAHDRRTAGTVVEDEAIEQKASSAVNNSGLGARAHINATSYNRALLLTGEVASPADRQRAEQIARSVEEVRAVYNELTVMPASSLGSRSSDAWITTKVKSSLFQVDGIRDFDPTRVKVVTERGIVYLMGLVRPQEAEAVTATVRRVGGVQRVVRLFEYLDA